MRNKTKKAFSLVELLIFMVIIGIVGGAAVAAMWIYINSFFQMDDYTSADTEMEYVAQRLSREFALIGLGMPNNRLARGSFALSFQNEDEDKRPIMALFGSEGSAWGGPVTVSVANPTNTYSAATLSEPDFYEGAYVGPELYYAWAVPTGVKANITNKNSSQQAKNGDELTLAFYPAAGGADTLSNLRWDGREVGVPVSLPAANPGRNMRTWMTFPTLRLPLQAENWDGQSLDVTVAPVPDSALPAGLSMERTIMDFDEVHILQAARLYRHAGTNELRRVVFGEDYTGTGANNVLEDTLARNIVGLQFEFNPNDRLLTMYIAARGNERNTAGSGQTHNWPDWLPEQISAADARYRIVVKTLTWRIRN